MNIFLWFHGRSITWFRCLDLRGNKVRLHNRESRSSKSNLSCNTMEWYLGVHLYNSFIPFYNIFIVNVSTPLKIYEDICCYRRIQFFDHLNFGLKIPTRFNYAVILAREYYFKGKYRFPKNILFYLTNF